MKRIEKNFMKLLLIKKYTMKLKWINKYIELVRNEMIKRGFMMINIENLNLYNYSIEF